MAVKAFAEQAATQLNHPKHRHRYPPTCVAGSLESKRSLAFQLLALLGVPLGHWWCTNTLAEVQTCGTEVSTGRELADLLLRDRLHDQGFPLSSRLPHPPPPCGIILSSK